MHVCLPGVLKTGSANLNFFQLFLSNIRLFTVLFTAGVGFFLLVFWLGICVEVDVDIITTPPRPVPSLCFCHSYSKSCVTKKCGVACVTRLESSGTFLDIY